MDVMSSSSCPKGYKQTEVGVIPTDWCVDALGPHVDITSGESPSRFRFTSGGIPYFKVDQINNNSKYLSDTPYFIRENRKVSRGSLIFPKRGASILLNKVRILAEDSFMDTNLMALTARASVHPEFLYYALTHIELWRIADTTSIPQINNKHIVPLLVPLPPTLAEQRAIAEALSDADALIESLEQLLAKKRAIKQAAMQQLLTGKTRLPGFSGEWAVKRLSEICEIAMGRTPPRLNPEFWGSGYTWLSIADLRAKVVTKSKEEITALAAADMRVIPKGTLLMSFKLSIGRLCFAGCDLYTNEAICSFNKLMANADFLYYVLGQTDFSLYGKQAVKGYTLNSESLKLVEVFLPSEAEQTAIATILSDMDAEIAALEQRRDKTRAIKQGMMQQLLTGRVRLVSAQEEDGHGS